MAKFLDNLGLSEGKPRHYHGDNVRTLFLIAATIMFFCQPFLLDQIPFSWPVSLAAIILLIFLAGLTNPRQPWVIFLDTVVALLGLVIFEYYVISRFSSWDDIFFWVNQTLALIFLLAFYFSTKTLRGLYLRGE